MVEHIVCFKPKPGTTPEQEQKLMDMARGLRDSVPGIVDLTVGRTFTPERGQGYTIALVVRFRDRAALDAYLPHPQHVPVKEYAGTICESILVMDYEV